MKNDYTTTLKRSGFMTAVLVMALSLMSVTASGQNTLIWNGGTDTDATNPLNWTPNEQIFGNILQVDSAKYIPNFPVLTLSGANDPINIINVASTSTFTIADAGDFLDINQGNGNYLSGNLVLQAGALSYRKNLYLENPSSVVDVEGGSLETRDNFAMGKKDLSSGGYLNISGTGKVHLRKVPIRFANDSLQSVITITDDATLEVRGDWIAGAEALIARNQIMSDDNFDTYAYYDVDNALTVVDLRSKDELFLISSGTIQALEDETLPAIEAVQNRGFENLVSMEWKYATATGGPYVSFDPAQIGESLDGVSFAAAGTYFIVLEGDTGAGTITSDEVQVSVTSPMVLIDPLAEQTIRVGWTGGMITATAKETATSFEWKYATVSGGPYASFATPVTTAEYIPDFADEGIYYVICEAVVSAVTYASPEATIKMVARNAASQTITWTGAYNTDAADNRNYDPMMHPWFNTVNIARDFVETPPVLASTGNDTIAYIALADSAKIIINKPATDTLTISGDGWQFGKIIIQGGVVNNRQYARLDGSNSGFILNNDAVLIGGGDGGFIIGQKDNEGPNGGVVTLNDNSRMWVPSGNIFRWSTDTTQSILTVADNARLELAGDITSAVATWILTQNQLQAPEGFELQYVYDATEDMTVVTAKSIVAFDIAPLDAQFVGIGLPIAELSTTNTDGITSQEWKYATSSGGDLTSFDPAETATTTTASFAAAGTYYVVCVGSDGSESYTSDEAIINVVSVEIAPAATQNLEEYEEGDLLTVTESVAPDSREWKSTTTSGSGYTSFSPARLSDTYKPFFTAEGTYFVVCESVYGGKAILSNEVEVVVTPETGILNKQSLDLMVYPNPSDGSFYIEVENSKSFSLEVFDITGKLVFQKDYINVNGPQEITLTNEGLHMLKVIQDNEVSIRKVLIK